MMKKQVQCLAIAGFLFSAALGIVTNVATAKLPPWLEKHSWLAWPVLVLLVLGLILMNLYQEKTPKRSDPLEASTSPTWQYPTTTSLRGVWYYLARLFSWMKRQRLLLLGTILLVIGLWWFLSPLFFPDHVYGQIRAAHFRGIQVELLTLFRQPIQDGPAVAVDTLHGNFVRTRSHPPTRVGEQSFLS